MSLPTPPADTLNRSGLSLVLALAEQQLQIQSISGLSVGLGYRALAEQKSPPRVVWVPSSDEYGPRGAQTGNPAAVATQWAGVDAHLWALTIDDVSGLARRVVLAVRKVALGSLKNGISGFSGRWVTQDEPVAGWSRLGEVYVLSFALAIPVLEPPLQTVTIKNFASEQHGTTGDGVLECGEQ